MIVLLSKHNFCSPADVRHLSRHCSTSQLSIVHQPHVGLNIFQLLRQKLEAHLLVTLRSTPVRF